MVSNIAIDPDTGRPYVADGGDLTALTQAVSNAGN